jgi:hypothetical protein
VIQSDRIISIYIPVWLPDGTETAIWKLGVQQRITLQKEPDPTNEKAFRYFATLIDPPWIFWQISLKEYRRLKQIMKAITKGDSDQCLSLTKRRKASAKRPS